MAGGGSMSITYRDLLANLQAMTDEQLNLDVTVFVSGVGEFYSLVSDFPMVVVNREIQNEYTPGSQESALDEGHPYLVI
jgi:hypothetical protein